MSAAAHTGEQELPERVRVLIADDHPPARAQVRQALESDGFVICAEVGDAPGAVSAALAELPDLCLLDIRMPGNGVAAAAEIVSRLPETSVVMFTVSRDDGDLFDALRAGASGYLLKDVDPSRLGASLRAVLAGEAALPGSLVARLIDEFRDRSPKRRLPLFKQRGAELTSREWEVLELLRRGHSTAEIAERLVVSQVTVRTHVSSVLRKLRVPDRESAVRLFAER